MIRKDLSINIILFMLVFAVGVCVAENNHSINLNIEDFAISSDNGYDRIEYYQDGHLLSPGHPELPTLGFQYIIPNDVRVMDVKLISTNRTRIPGQFKLYPAENSMSNSAGRKTIPDDSIYSSYSPYPGTPIKLSGSGYFRGHHIAQVVVNPFEYIPAEQSLFFYSQLEFEFILDYGSNLNTEVIKKIDNNTIMTLFKTVENPSAIQNIGQFNAKLPTVSWSYPQDSIPMMIICDDALIDAFDYYAEYQIERGVNLEVIPIWQIEAGLGGGTLQEKIRSFIRDKHNSFHLEYVLLAGDVNTIPPVYVVTIGDTIATDQFYSCLDGSWNDDGDTLYAEIGEDGDIDIIPDVYIGRIPCRDATEASRAINKIERYETYSDAVNYVTHAIFTSSYLFRDNDGREWNDQLKAMLPSHFTTEDYYNEDSTTVMNSISGGCGLLVNCSHAQHQGNFCTLWEPPMIPAGLRQTIEYMYFDTLSNYRYSVFLNRTCHYNYYNTDNSLARSFILSGTGGGIGYIGPSNKEWTAGYSFYHRKIFETIFLDGEGHLGKVMTDSKAKLAPYCHSDNAYRSAFLTYNYLGDPHLEMWTAQPDTLTYYGPDSLEKGYQDFHVVVTDASMWAPGALVCLSTPNKSVYEVAYTGENGIAYFNDVYFPYAGDIQVCITKHNYFPTYDAIKIYEPPGCPMLYAWNNGKYEFINNILAQSDNLSLSNQENPDAYPIYHAPVLPSGRLKLRIREDEREKSFINFVGASAVIYPSNRNVVFTNNGSFHFGISESLTPASATDQNGNNVLPQLSNRDGIAFTSFRPSFLTVTYEIPLEYQKTLGDGPGGGIDPGDPIKGIEKVFTDTFSLSNSNTIIVSALNKFGKWEDIDIRYPRFLAVKYITDLSDYFINGGLNIRVSWTNAITIDALPLQLFEHSAIKSEELQLIRATHSNGGEISSLFEQVDGDQATIIPGQHIDLEFGYIRPPINHSVAVAFNCYGRYEKWDGGTGSDFVFEQNYPNPFNPFTTFAFAIPEPTHVKLDIYNILGQKVTSLINDYYPPGRHTLIWNGTDDLGKSVASGIYLSTFRAADYQTSKKIVILK